MKFFITPLQDELNALVQGLRARGFQDTSTQIGRLTVHLFPELEIGLTQGGHGKAQFALQTQHLLDFSNDVDLVVCTGVAGALSEELSIGDIVVATTTVEHDFLLKFVTRPIPQFSGSPEAIASLLQLPSAPFKMHYGMVASGDEDIVAIERAQALFAATDALAVAWEGAGGARACAFSGIPFLEIRSISDTANSHAPTDFKTNLILAMDNIAGLIVSWFPQK